MITDIAPFLAFTGNAATAIRHYEAVLPDARLSILHSYGPGEEGAEGTVKFAVLQIGALCLRIIDVPPESGVSMGAGVSVFVTCDSAEDVDRIADGLGEGGGALMPPGAYPFADRFAWIADRFGVNWQLIYGHRLESGAG